MIRLRSVLAVVLAGLIALALTQVLWPPLGVVAAVAIGCCLATMTITAAPTHRLARTR